MNGNSLIHSLEDAPQCVAASTFRWYSRASVWPSPGKCLAHPHHLGIGHSRHPPEGMPQINLRRLTWWTTPQHDHLKHFSLFCGGWRANTTTNLLRKVTNCRRMSTDAVGTRYGWLLAHKDLLRPFGRFCI